MAPTDDRTASTRTSVAISIRSRSGSVVVDVLDVGKSRTPRKPKSVKVVQDR